jgi:hypothetical protein
VQQRRQCFDCPRKVKFVNALCKERANPCSFVWAVSCLSELHVPTRPLLQECRQKCACEADEQAEKPE